MISLSGPAFLVALQYPTMGMEEMIQRIMRPGYEKGRPEWKLLFPHKYLINIQVSHMGW